MTPLSIAGKKVNERGCQDRDKQGLNPAAQPGDACDTAKKHTKHEYQQQRDRHRCVKWRYRQGKTGIGYKQW